MESTHPAVESPLAPHPQHLPPDAVQGGGLHSATSDSSRLLAAEPTVLRVIDRISRTSAAVAGAALIAMLVHVVLDVASRTLLNAPLPGTLAIITFWWMPTIVFLSLGATELAGGHIQVSLLIDRLTRRMGRVIRSLDDLIVATGIAILLYFAVLGAIDATILQKVELGVINIPVWFPRIIAAVGLAIYFLQVMASLWRLQQPTAGEGDTNCLKIPEVAQ